MTAELDAGVDLQEFAGAEAAAPEQQVKGRLGKERGRTTAQKVVKSDSGLSARGFVKPDVW